MRRLPVITPGPLPPRYSEWMDRVVPGPIPDETVATCDDCAMCAPAGTTGSERFYDPGTKCCTYVPSLPNFVVGRILGDDDPAATAGRMTVEARVCRGVAVTPLGLGAPPTFAALYAVIDDRAFGRRPDLRCPHYLEDGGGRCGIWRHRTAVCATWFCKHVRGATGVRFWLAVYELLSGLERALARWCVLEHDVDAAGAAWGRWSGRESEFYRGCDDLVRRLEWDDVLAIGGQEARLAVQRVHDAYAALVDETIPAALQIGHLHVEPMGRQSYRVWAHSEGDALELPKKLLEVLPFFDGGPTARAQAAIVRAAGVKLDAQLIRRLADFEILVPPDAQR